MEKILTDPTSLLNLPWATLVTLACGYMGYYIANVGIRDHHKQIDIAFSTLVFGFIAAFSYQVARHFELGILVSSVYAVVDACLAGALWRVAGRRLMRWVLRVGDISHADDVPSAWLSLFEPTSVRATELSVRLKDGTVLLSQDLDRFKNKPNGPFVLGSTGDVLLYVTDTKPAGSDEWVTEDDVDYEDWGSVITHVAASEISRVRFRRK
jgi:hypothetical protein